MIKLRGTGIFYTSDNINTNTASQAKKLKRSLINGNEHQYFQLSEATKTKTLLITV